MENLRIQIPEKFLPLFEPWRYKAYYGGRGSAKSHSFATVLIIQATKTPLRVLCTREFQTSIKDSVKKLIDDKIIQTNQSDFYESTDTEIRGKNGSAFIFAGLKNNINSIKSMEGIDICWIEEANVISQSSLDVLIPTIRKEGSELWFSWNPVNDLDPVDMMFRGPNAPPNAIIGRVSWRDNPFFPRVLKDELEQLKAIDLQKYLHIWEGEYNLISEGAYYAQEISKIIADGRIKSVPYDENALVYAAVDLGISDSFSIWFAQFVGEECHVIDFLENAGERIEYYAEELRKRGYNYAPLILPHDARSRELGTGKSIEEMFQKYGFQTTICPNIPVIDGIQAGRNLLKRSWFDADKCNIQQSTGISGLKALQAYRENYDERLRISRGPLHDWSSHASDAWRYLSVARQANIIQKEPLNYLKGTARMNPIKSVGDLEELFSKRKRGSFLPTYRK